MLLLNYGEPCNSKRNLLKGQSSEILLPFLKCMGGPRRVFQKYSKTRSGSYSSPPRPIHICQKTELNSRWPVPLK